VTADGLIDLAHPEAADWLLGTLEPAAAAEFGDHLAGCGDCRTAVAELGHVGRVLQQLPPAVEPPPDLAARIVDSVLAAAAGDRTEVHLPRLPAAVLAPRPRPQAPPAQRPLPPPELASLYHPSPGTRHRRAPAARNGTPAPAAGAARPARRGRVGPAGTPSRPPLLLLPPSAWPPRSPSCPDWPAPPRPRPR